MPFPPLPGIVGPTRPRGIPTRRCGSSTRGSSATASTTRRSSASRPATGGPRARSGSATTAAWCGATSRTTGCCAGTSATGVSDGVPQPVELRQRQHPRRAGPARHLRAPDPAGDPDRARRHASPCSPTATTARRLNAPNDVVVSRRRRGVVHRPGLRDPVRLRGRQGRARAADRGSTGSTRTAACSSASSTSLERPNGLCFSPDESLLYVVDSGPDADTSTSYDCRRGGRPDGRRVRRHEPGHLGRHPLRRRRQPVGGGGGGGDGYDGVHVFAPDGTRIGQVVLPEQCANLCFGGRARNRLFMAAGQSVYAVYLDVSGA